MATLVEFFESTPNKEVWNVVIGDIEYALCDFEEVDSTIYSDDGIIVATVVEKLSGDLRFHKPGTKIEFDTKEVSLILKGDQILYSTGK